MKEDDPISQDGRNRWQEAIDAWIGGQPNAGDYQPPTEMCNTSDDIVVLLEKPQNETIYDTEDIEIEVRTYSEKKIERVEIYVDGEKRESLSSRPYTTKIYMSTGRHEIYAKAFAEGGKDSQTGTYQIGTGGADWKKEEPTPTPSPWPSPQPTPSPVASPVSTPTILPNLGN